MFKILESDIPYSQAAINGIKRYDERKERLMELENKLLEIDCMMRSLTRCNEAPVSGNKNENYRTEELIDRKVKIEKDINELSEYLAFFDRIWEKLTEEEQVLLRARYSGEPRERGIEWCTRPCMKLFISRREAYRRADKALDFLCKGLYYQVSAL